MAAPDALYQEQILQHYRRPHNKGALPHANARASVVNPACGDEITVEAIVEGGIVREARFTGQGCSIAQASASMMTEMARGASVGAVRRTAEALRKLLAKESVTRDALGELLAFEVVARYPARVGCAMMPWRALEQAITDQAAT
ncbi:MAG TPA: SUF system NifU family Fe-S cluster assembly protein [Gemmatimonadaceae bacterium]|nr:SUF system NifU family Fe-S cluster assembly protein [Gemmatimonadaceae bacterium]